MGRNKEKSQKQLRELKYWVRASEKLNYAKQDFPHCLLWRTFILSSQGLCQLHTRILPISKTLKFVISDIGSKLYKVIINKRNLQQEKSYVGISLVVQWLRIRLPGCAESTVWEFRMDRYTLLYLKWITSRDLLYRSWNSIQCYMAVWMGGEFGEEWIHVYAWLTYTLHCSPETIRTLLTGYIPMQNKKFKVWKKIMVNNICFLTNKEVNIKFFMENKCKNYTNKLFISL